MGYRDADMNLEFIDEHARDMMGNMLMVGDKIAVAVMNSELVIGEIVEIKTVNSNGEAYTVWGHGGRKRSYAVKIRVDARGGRHGTVSIGRKHMTYEYLGRALRLGTSDKDFDYEAFISSLRETAEGLKAAA